MSLKGKLNRYKKHIGTEQKGEISGAGQSKSGNGDDRIDIPYLQDWNNFQTEPFQLEGQYILVREREYPLDHRHGHYALGEIHTAVGAWNSRDTKHPLSSSGRAASDLLFFDTETTGLGHGAGNTIFLLGVARINNKSVTVTQYFLPGPGHEVALYQRFLGDVKELKNLVTYNGKAFDWPQVKSRHTLLRDLVPTLPAFGHFDLLHASRRLWKNSLPAVKLSVVEEEMLGVKRDGDIPGYLAPMLYFDFLKEPNPEAVKGIIEHNETDVLSLITLYTHLTGKLLGEGANVSDEEHYEIGRWLEDLGHADEALRRYEGISHKDSPVSKLAKKGAARLYKKAGLLEEAERIWLSLESAGEFQDPEIAVELAKVNEHSRKDIEKALHYAEAAYSCWKMNQRIFKSKAEKEKAEYIKRIERLRRKSAGE